MEVAVAGSSGLIGSALVRSLEQSGHRVRRLVRGRPSAGGEVSWDPARASLDREGLRGIEAAVNLCGENLAAGRWTAGRKQRIRSSRVDSTRLLAEALASLEPRPAVLLNASAIGFYGDRGDEDLDESSAAGQGFLAELAVEWENATAAAERAGVRVVKLRTGVVLSAKGGALAKMLPLFRLGLGGRIGSGSQQMSWISLEDEVRAIRFAMEDEALSGPVNLVSPAPVTNAEFTRALGRVLGRPTILPVPALAIRLLFGEMGRETVLSGARIFPRRLELAGFRFEHPNVESALRAAIAPL